MSDPEFFKQETQTDRARLIRLTMAQRMVRRGIITRQDALDLLNGNLSPDSPGTYYDDRAYLDLKLAPLEQEDDELMTEVLLAMALAVPPVDGGGVHLGPPDSEQGKV